MIVSRDTLRLIRRLAMVILLTTAVVASASAQMEPVCVPAEGAPFAAPLTVVDSNWQMRFGTGDGARSLSGTDVVRWGALAEPAAGSQLLLSDGGLLIALIKNSDRDRITVDSQLFGELQIPLELVAGILFEPPSAVERYDRALTSIRRAQGNVDRAQFDNGDELAGSLRALTINAADGSGTLTLESESGTLDMPTAHLSAIIFNPTLIARPAPPALHAWVGFRDGTCLLAASLALDTPATGKGTAWITLPGKLTWQTSASDVVFVQPRGGRARYLSHVDPVGYRQLSFLETPEVSWELGHATSASGRQLRCRGERYLEGIGMHSASRASYAIEPEDRRFEALIAIDDEAGTRGSVVFRVYVDEEQKYASPTIRGGEPPVPISVDVRGGKRLHLIVDFADRGDQLDRADWLDARLVR